MKVGVMIPNGVPEPAEKLLKIHNLINTDSLHILARRKSCEALHVKIVLMKRILAAIILMALGAFLWWAFSPLLFDKEIKDELDPELAARLEAQRQVDENRAKSQLSGKQNDDDTAMTVEPKFDAETGVTTAGPFPIAGTLAHPASGMVEVIQSPEENLIYFKNYSGTNGPELYVYLSKDKDAKEFISLGEAKGNKGDIIYGVPLDVDISEYKYVLTWCKAFGVLFDYAQIN